MNKLLCKKAFTLAETLIVLLIIGIVAALVIPIAITKYQKLQTETKVKKVYSTLENAIELAKIDHGDPINWDWSESYHNNAWGPFFAEKFTNILFPYLNASKKTTYVTDVKHLNEADGSFHARTYYNLILTDGTTIQFGGGGYSWSSDPWVFIQFDINGANKPNIYGKDIFIIYFYAKKGLYSSRGVSWHAPYKNYKREEIMETCKTSSISTYCLDLIKDNGWKIPDDYPW